MGGEREIPLEEPLLICYNFEESPYCYDGNYLYEYIIQPNNELIKNSEYYFIDYQYIVEEGNLNNLNSSNSEPNIYFGKTNRLKFKLCHDYCGICKELGKSDDDQKCLSCLPEYQYDYL